MSGLRTRIKGCAGVITLARPEALNALTYDMLREIEATLDRWANDDAVRIVLFDADGDKAFCAGGDIADLYNAGRAGDFTFGRDFWRDEYRLNAKIAEYPKPTVSFMQGFTMGGGVGIGCHCAHRIVGQNSKIAMPECGIGLVPDVGGSLILARAPGRIGEYLGLTGTRMGPADAILAGFADHFIPESHWSNLRERLETSGDVSVIAGAVETPPPPALSQHRPEIDRHFAAPSLADLLASLETSATDFARATLNAIQRNSPLSMACTLNLIAQVRTAPTIRAALTQEYRFTARASEHGDFLEGIRAAIIDKDRTPHWKFSIADVTPDHVAQMMAPLGDHDLSWETET